MTKDSAVTATNRREPARRQGLWIHRPWQISTQTLHCNFVADIYILWICLHSDLRVSYVWHMYNAI